MLRRHHGNDAPRCSHCGQSTTPSGPEVRRRRAERRWRAVRDLIAAGLPMVGRGSWWRIRAALYRIAPTLILTRALPAGVHPDDIPSDFLDAHRISTKSLREGYLCWLARNVRK